MTRESVLKETTRGDCRVAFILTVADGVACSCGSGGIACISGAQHPPILVSDSQGVSYARFRVLLTPCMPPRQCAQPSEIVVHRTQVAAESRHSAVAMPAMMTRAHRQTLPNSDSAGTDPSGRLHVVDAHYSSCNLRRPRRQLYSKPSSPPLVRYFLRKQPL